MAAKRIFLDTNVLVYAAVTSSPLNEVSRSTIIEHKSRGFELWISRQVLREYLAVMTRPGQFPISPSTEAILNDVRYFQSHFNVAEEDGEVTKELLRLMTSHQILGKQVHDANIVATMIANGIKTLLTHNTADFKRFMSNIKVVPLAP
jgi:predicted nucleic acid-binding protein